MSSRSEQAGLDAFAGGREPSRETDAERARTRAAERLDGEGARYCAPKVTDAARGVERCETRGECRTCEAEVPTEVQRVVGDNNGCVPVCPECIADEIGHPSAARVEKWVSALDVWQMYGDGR